MAASILPTAEEWRQLAPHPGTVTCRRAGDARLLVCAGYALLLQVSHPTVGAGVSDHSQFRHDPWGRLLRTLDYLYSVIYADPRTAWSVARRMRAQHAAIRGVSDDGRPYDALDPEPFAWVHATLADSIIHGHLHLGLRLRTDEIECFYDDWRRLGRLIGVRAHDLPPDWRGFCAYRERMISERLEDNAAVQELLATFGDPVAPPLRWLREPVWKIARIPAVQLVSLATAGLLPPSLRERFGIDWSAWHQSRFKAVCALSRASGPLLPPGLRVAGPHYLRWRARTRSPGVADRGEMQSVRGSGGSSR
jgi:uncharacterized protein (DUF2236 family)